MLEKQELCVFSYLEIFLSGRHLSLRLSGSFPFRSPFPSSLSQLASGFNSRLDKPCTDSQKYLRLKNNLQDNAISSGKSKKIKVQEWMADMRLTYATQKQRQNHIGMQSLADKTPEITLLGEGFGKNDTHR
jgi:hypothetical protein